MTAIHIREPALTIRAGRRAMQRLRETPLSPEDVVWDAGGLRPAGGIGAPLTLTALAEVVHEMGLPTGALGHAYFQTTTKKMLPGPTDVCIKRFVGLREKSGSLGKNLLEVRMLWG